MNKKQILIVEDELIIARSIRRKLENEGYIVLGSVIDYEEAIQSLQKHSADLVLIDIRLNGSKTGIDLAEYIKHNNPGLPYIFLTSYTDSTTINLAKKTNPAAYLIKPFNPNSLTCTIEVVLHNSEITNTPPRFILLDMGNKSEKVNINDIIYIEADHVYVHVVFHNRKLLIRSSLTGLLEQLPPDLFFKSHRSFGVNISYIQSITSSSILMKGFEIPLSRANRDKLKLLLEKTE